MSVYPSKKHIYAWCKSPKRKKNMYTLNQFIQACVEIIGQNEHMSVYSSNKHIDK
mgnify:CR=1 FL=1